MSTTVRYSGWNANTKYHSLKAPLASGHVSSSLDSTDNIEASEKRGLNAYVSTSRQTHGKPPRPSRGPAPRDLDARGRMVRKIRSKAGQAIYALRKIIVEQVFGQIKGARGLDRFLLRGLKRASAEWALMAITHNIGKMHRAALAAA